MKTITTTKDIAATPEQVWAVLIDLEAYPQWNPFLRKAAGTVAVGERLVITLQPEGGKAMTMKPTLDDVDAGKLLRWTGHLLVRGIFDGQHGFALTALPDGGTRLVQSENFSGILVPFVGKILRTTERSFHALNDALAVRVAQVYAG